MDNSNDSFSYRRFEIAADGRTVSFWYLIERAGEQYELHEELVFPVALNGNNPAIMAGLRALHLALGVSYYKIFVSQQIIQPYVMTAAEAGFWNDVWHHGLGEFMHLNDIAAERLAQFGDQAEGLELSPASALDVEFRRQALLGIGGGKDSIVAGELLKSLAVPTTGFVMATGEQLGQAQAVAQTMNIDLHIIERRLDQQLLELQERPDAFKGHVPISLIFGLVGTVLAAATGASDVVVANEASASIPRTEGINGAVNHQWSKSYEFEQQLQTYVRTTVSPAITYYSAIRPLTSVAVAKLFAQHPPYFEVFTSDNYVFRIDPSRRPNGRWSLESPKSLSSFILFSPWLSEADMLRTFGRNFLDEPSLEVLFAELTGLQGTPPLDCVGTVEELVLSLQLTAQQDKFGNAHLMQLARDRGLLNGHTLDDQLSEMLQLRSEQAFPQPLAAQLLAQLQESLSA